MKFAVINLIGVGALSMLIISCSNDPYRNIYTNKDKSVDFNQYSSFAWAPDDEGNDGKTTNESAYDNDIVRNNAKNYITNNFIKRGYILDIDSPDLLLQLVLLNEKKEKVITYHTHSHMGYYYYSPFYFPYYYPYYNYYTWHRWGPPFWDHETTTYTKSYLKGTITVNVFDAKEKKLIWTGIAEGDLYDPSYFHYDVHPAIDRIMKRFPGKPLIKKATPSFPVVRNNGVNRNNFGTPSH